MKKVLVAGLVLSMFGFMGCKETDEHAGHMHEGAQTEEMQMDQMEGSSEMAMKADVEGSGMEMQEEFAKQTFSTSEAKVGDKVVCPVMGSKITVTENSLFAQVDGKKYFACCGGCPAAIEKDPKKYLSE